MALIGTLRENWASGIDALVWNNYGGSPYVTIDAGRLKLVNAPASSNYYGIVTQAAYDWTNGFASVKIDTLPTLDPVNDPEITILLVSAEIDSNNRYYIAYEGAGALKCFKVTAGAYAYQGGVRYAAATHKYVRVSFGGGNVYYEYSTDGITWTIIASTTVGVAITALQLAMVVGHYVPVAGTYTSYLDDINILPQKIAAAGIASGAAFGTPTVSLPGIPAGQNITAVGAIASGATVGTPTLTLQNAKIHTLIDTFGAINPVVWNNFGAVIDNERLSITKPLGGTYYGMVTQARYDIKDSKVYIEVIDPGNFIESTYEAVPLLVENIDQTSRVYISLSRTTIGAWYYLNGTFYKQAEVAYDPNAHKWFQIRESDNFLFYEYGLDGITWQLLAAVDTDPILDLTSLALTMLVGDYAEAADRADNAAQTAIYDNMNVPLDFDRIIYPLGFEASSELTRVGTPYVFDPSILIISDAGVDPTDATVGTPTVIGDGVLTVPSMIEQAGVGRPTVTGTLAVNDTAPTYDFYRASFLPLRDIVAGVYISFVRAYDAEADFFTVGTSPFNSGDVWQGDGSTIQEWDKFDFDDYSDYISTIQYHQEQDLLGSMVMGYADITLRNQDGLFSPYGDSPIAPYILPNRPMKILAGFKNRTMQVFVGQTMRLPEASKDTAKFHAKDFIASFADVEITAGAIYQNVTTDEVIDDVFINIVGLSPVQYTLDVGLNTIGFLHVAPGTKVGELLRKLCEAEQGRLYQDANGRLLFKNRTNKQRATALKLIPEIVLSEKEPQVGNVINRVKITSDVRTVLTSRQVFPGLKDGSLTLYDDFQSLKVAPGETLVKFWDMKNPVTAYTHPSVGAGITANSAQDGTGLNRNADLTFQMQAAFTDTVKYAYTNNGLTDLYVMTTTIQGTPAVVTSQIRVDIIDQPSIDKYGEKLHDVTNDYFTSSTFAATTAAQILAANKEAPFTREIAMRGIPYMQVGDVVEYHDGLDYVVDLISGSISASDGNKQEARLRRV